MRILHVINQLTEGGAEVSLKEIVFGTSDEFAHGLVAFAPVGESAAVYSSVGVPVFEPVEPLASRRARYRHTAAAIRSYEPDLVHTVLFEADLIGRIAARRARVPSLSSLVNTPYAPEAWPERRVDRAKLACVKTVDGFLGRHATTAFHAITEAVATATSRDLGIDPARITVVPRGRSTHRLGGACPARRMAVRKELGLEADTPVVVHLGRQEPQKGQVFLLRAVAQLVRERPDLKLVMAGREGRSTTMLKAEVANSRLEDSVIDLGFRDDVGDILCAGDVFAFPSLYEGLGGSVLEAMALRVPIVATAIPALLEVLDQGRCARLVPPRDPGALAGAIGELLDDRVTAVTLGERAKARFDAGYSLEACIEGMRRLYRSLGS